MPDRDLCALACPLPDDIALLKGAGEYALAIAAIDRQLETPLPQILQKRLRVERMFLQRLPAFYPLTEEALLAQLQAQVRDFTKDELYALLTEGRLDFISQAGKRMYHEDTVSSLLKSTPALNERTCKPYDVAKSALNAVIARMKAGDRVFRCRLRATLRIRNFVPGEVYRIHLPIPARSMQQSAAEDMVASLPINAIDPADAPQRTVYFERLMDENVPLTLEYTFTQRPRYVNPLDESVQSAVYPDARPVCAQDLQEEAPHLLFTPYLRALAQELRGEESDPVRLARRFYDFVTAQVKYAYQRPYLLIENGAEYAALNRRGDCGLQALLFIALCRISGIPARWQSGLYAEPGDVGSHDWAEFYSPRLGWLPVDCSFGGTARRGGAEEGWNFYFGNLDPWRMVANRAYFAPFAPEKRFPRRDPYDNQRGEVETQTRGLGAGEFSTRYEMLWSEETEAEK